MRTTILSTARAIIINNNSPEVGIHFFNILQGRS